MRARPRNRHHQGVKTAHDPGWGHRGSQETLPIWIFTNYSRPNQLPIVNVVGLSVVLLSIVPVYLANRVSRGSAAVVGGST
jgi:hypothetical protein